MDTREKIISPEMLPNLETTARIVIGYFDPLFAGNVNRLQEISGGARLTVIVADHAGAILPLRARAELVASLACVDRVIPCAAGAAELAERLAGGELGSEIAHEIIDEREADERRARALSAHIVDRYRPE